MPFAFTGTDDQHRTDDQQLPHVALAHLGNVLRPIIAANRGLSRDQAKPSGEISPFPEVLIEGAEGLKCHSGLGSDTWHDLPFMCFCVFFNLDIQPRGFKINGLNLLEVYLDHQSDHLRGSQTLIGSASQTSGRYDVAAVKKFHILASARGQH